MVSRRTFILTGAAGAAALAAAYWLRVRPAAVVAAPAPLDPAARTIVRAIIPAMLGPALPSEPSERAAAIERTENGVAIAIAGLPPAAQHELSQLFALLDFAPARKLLAGLQAPWAAAEVSAVGATLDGWRTSRLDLLRSAYDALHQLVFAAWYGDPAAWAAIGYGGPPAIAARS